jgi:ubiquinone/menaquinone biosynthesis C-methylase UbiE
MADSREYFDGIASQWDEFRKNLFPESVRTAAFRKAGLIPGKIAADLGAGTGFITEGLVDNGMHVIAVDQSPAMLEAMKMKFGENGPVHYQIGTAEQLPIPSASVDYVFANMYLHHVESPPEALTEIARILKPGGKVIITDLDEHTFEFLRTEQHDRWMGFKRNDIISWFQEIGLENVHMDCVGETCCSASDDGSEQAAVSIFIATGSKP